MSKIHIPASRTEQWASFLAEPEKYWRQGYSARTLAYPWQEAIGVPAEIESVLASAFPAIELLLAVPEHQVPLPGGSRPSQNDTWVLAQRHMGSGPLRGRTDFNRGCIRSLRPMNGSKTTPPLWPTWAAARQKLRSFHWAFALAFNCTSPGFAAMPSTCSVKPPL